MLVMYTDGVPEAMNPSMVELGFTRFHQILSGLSDMSSMQVIETIKACINAFVDGADQSDDITMLVMKRK